ncbi:hypothetical protein K469DRAFT_565217 [Zopfia rhizophila CBS 207.26]|uniref:HAUS augmin-like complex subunit 3 N-terminal domain-containing protein n=1 Tax=Zopfia rhizophila CBS 207.26 TaxID=1314779 RepID=A0A6A6EDE6_9PEZI|nr:hypothetical protein K469DRAFT_565217 [Zopfia rhizophila CBS 207.26]
MAEEAAAHHLLNVLEERDLSVDLDKVLAVFEDEDKKREAAAWVMEYLDSSTLLTKEELDLYQALEKKGVVHQYENDDTFARPILDHELTSAIESLQSSTAAIEEQCKVLEAQRDALVALKALDKPNLEVEHMRNERRRRQHQEKARLDISIEDVSSSLNEQLTDSQREIETEKSTLKTYVTERLASDDKILTALPKIVSNIVAEPEVSEDEKSIEQWCKAIISFRTAEIKARVDATYLNSLSHNSPGDLPDASEDELRERKEALQAELETLHSEISSVAEMVVEHELRKPIMELKERKEKQRAHARSAWLKYVLSTLEYMSNRLNIITMHTQKVSEFQLALSHVNEAASKRMPDPSTEALTPSRKRATSVPKSAFSPAVKLNPKKTAKLPPALEDALRHASLSFKQDSIEALQETLIKAQLEREKKLEDHYSSTSSSTQESLADVFGKADVDLRAILDALYSHTPYQQVHLTNPSLDEKMKKLEKELTGADQKLLSAEGSELSLSDPKVKAFISRYGEKK